MIRIARATVVCAGLLVPLPGVAQTAAPPVAATEERAAMATSPASARHVLAKTLTLNLGDAAALMTIFATGTGSLPAATFLTAGTIVIGFVTYPINEYLWDYYRPNTNLSANNGAFDAAASLWRTSYKYVTFKVAVVVGKFGWLYAYTGSAAATLTMGVPSSLALPAIFYINNTAWDWYDWRSAAATGESASSTSTAPR